MIDQPFKNFLLEIAHKLCPSGIKKTRIQIQNTYEL